MGRAKKPCYVLFAADDPTLQVLTGSSGGQWQRLLLMPGRDMGCDRPMLGGDPGRLGWATARVAVPSDDGYPPAASEWFFNRCTRVSPGRARTGGITTIANYINLKQKYQFNRQNAMMGP